MRTVLGRDPRSGACLAVTVTDGRVRLVEPAATTTTEGLPWVSPGLTDLQVNGFHGHELNDPSLSTEAIDALRRALRAEGVTTFVPTVISGSRDHTAAILRALARARRQSTALREAIPYVHLEGPYISAEEGPRGCHDPRHIRRPDADEFAAWQEQAEGAIGMVTLSPHWAEAIDFTARLHRAGVRVSIGHTHAGPERIAEAVAAGARFSTHLGNGAHATLPRHPNYLWAQLADRRLTAGFIADGHHLDGATLTAMLRAKGLAHAFLVSDVTSAGGTAPGLVHTAVGGDVEVTDDGRLVIPGTSFLAGASDTLAHGVARLASLPSFSLAQALRLATRNPARVVGDTSDAALRPGTRNVMTFRWRPGDASLKDVQLVEG